MVSLRLYSGRVVVASAIASLFVFFCASAPHPTQKSLVQPFVSPTYVNSKDGSVLFRVSSGTFLMGSDRDEVGERPLHRVGLGDYYIGRISVTNRQFRTFVIDSGYRLESEFSAWMSYADDNGEDAPVVDISHRDAVAYCHWAGLRLPTEEEWEKAARGTDGRRFPWGADTSSVIQGRMAVKRGRDDDSRRPSAGCDTSDVSPYGCCNMCTNVLEWTNSIYRPYPGNREWPTAATKDCDPPNAGRDGGFHLDVMLYEWLCGPAQIDEDFYVCRGGTRVLSSVSVQEHRCSRRNGTPTGSHEGLLGFRVARDP